MGTNHPHEFIFGYSQPNACTGAGRTGFPRC